MIELRENLRWLVGSISAGVAIVLAYLEEYEFLGTLLGTVIGAGIAYFVQNRTQKRTWKREYAVRLAEEVYGKLYRDLKWIIWTLKRKEIAQLNFESWGVIQEDYRYFMVDEKFAEKLDQFFQRVRKYNDSIYELKAKILPKIISEIGSSVFERDVDEIIPHIKFNEGRNSSILNPPFIDCLLSKTHPEKYFLEQHPEAQIIQFGFKFGKESAEQKYVERFDKFWGLCLNKMSKNKTYLFIKEEKEKIPKEAKILNDEVVKRIREPWNI